jgi:hypothetical protein
MMKAATPATKPPAATPSAAGVLVAGAGRLVPLALGKPLGDHPEGFGPLLVGQPHPRHRQHGHGGTLIAVVIVLAVVDARTPGKPGDDPAPGAFEEVVDAGPDACFNGSSTVFWWNAGSRTTVS